VNVFREAGSYPIIKGDMYFLLPEKSVGQMLGWILSENVHGDCNNAKDPSFYKLPDFDDTIWKVSQQYPLPSIFKIRQYVEPTKG
jgi:hypothetical protein